MTNTLLLRRRGMMAAQAQPIIPYQRVEYLEATGTQWILLSHSGRGYGEIDVAASTLSKSTSRLFFCNTNNGSGGSWFGVQANGSKWGLGSNISFSEDCTTRVAALVRLYGVTYMTATATINGTTKTRTGTANVSGFGRWALFASNEGTLTAEGKIYYFKAYTSADQILVGDYIPVRIGTVGYMYDRVSGQLFGNAGTGDFVLGPDII